MYYSLAVGRFIMVQSIMFKKSGWEFTGVGIVLLGIISQKLIQQIRILHKTSSYRAIPTHGAVVDKLESIASDKNLGYLWMRKILAQ